MRIQDWQQKFKDQALMFLSGVWPIRPAKSRRAQRAFHGSESLEHRLLLSGSPVAAEVRPAQAVTGNDNSLAGAAAQTSRHEIVFIDTAVSGYQQLLADVHSDATRNVETVLIDSSHDGVDQISQALAGEHDLDAIHIISHGADGALELGSTTLDFSGLLDRFDAIRGWGDALAADADILLYGCDVAEDASGRAFVDGLSHLTGADVAASSNLTGSSGLGGDWDLEYHDGLVQTGALFSASAPQNWQGVLAITQDAVSSASAAAANSLTFAHTVGSGSNRLLLVEVVINKGGTTVSSVTYGGTALTKVGSAVNAMIHTELWYLRAPATATANVVVPASGGNPEITAGATSFFGVDQTTPLGTAVTANGKANPPSASVTVASAAGELVIAVAGVHQGTSYTTGGGQSELWQLATGTGGASVWGASDTESGAASVQMNWSVSISGGAGEWAEAAVAIKPVSNDAPTLTNGATVTLTGTSEDSPSSGTTVNSLLTSAGWADADAGALSGLAITS